MSEDLVLRGTNKMRVRLVVDQYSANPRMQWDHIAHVVTVHNIRYIDVDSDGGPLADGWNRLTDDLYDESKAVEIFERWAKIFYGATTLYDTPYDGANAVWYVLPADLERERIISPADSLLRIERDEYRAWTKGEVYGYVIERSVNDEYGEDWQEVDSCYGYYGFDWAYKEATEAFADLIGKNG